MGPVALARERESMLAVPADGEPIVPPNMARVRTPLDGSLLLPRGVGSAAGSRTVRAIPDGNRAAILEGAEVSLWGRGFLVGVKGVGARAPMYDGDGPMPGWSPDAGTPLFTSESWFGESPWGAMGKRACEEDAAITGLAGPDGIRGMHICPMVRATPLPGWLMERAMSQWWYRRLDGGQPYYQEVRLLPSDVRLFYQAESTLGRRTGPVLEAFGVDGEQGLDAFIERYLASGMAALTLAARTVEEVEGRGVAALDYADVWLDKDSVLAPDGTLFFADIEGLEWVVMRDDEEALARMRRQFERNAYEYLYGADRLLRERERMAGAARGREERRRDLGARLTLALERDPYVAVEEGRAHMDLVMMPHEGHAPELRLRMLDFEEGAT
jgi:hypothetical protein